MIETLLNWSEPRERNTRRGLRYVSTAEPTPKFWGLWRSDKESLKAAGISCRPVGNGWEVTWWRESLSAPSPFVPAPVKVVDTIPVQSDGVNWSPEQLAIFDWFAKGSGHLVVIARAGTGKTTTIKAAFNHAPEQGDLLYAVFNKKNQIEAEAKITDPRVEVRTLHSLGFRFIKSVWSNAEPNNDVELDRVRAVEPTIPDEVAEIVCKLVGFAKNLIVEPVLNEIINIAEERGISAPDASEAEGWTVRSLAATAQKAMEAAKQRDATGRVSFDDMVWLPVAAGWVKPVFELVVVDEAQDMNLPQLIMAERASKGRICVVGDDRQAIYGFRGAASDGLAMMERKLGAARLGLTTTYRCPKSVVNLAQSIVTDYHAAPEAPEGQVVSLSVDSAISDLAPGDAVLSRLNAPLASIALGLLRKGIPARVEGRDIGKTLVAAVRKLRAKSVPDFLRKLEAQTEKQIARITARGGKSAPVKIEQVNDQSETLTAIAEGCTNVEEVESRIKNLFEDSDRSRKPAVVCSSVHKAKGLEWNKVVLLQYTFKRKGQLQLAGEEGNVYYVAVTRAKKILVIAED